MRAVVHDRYGPPEVLRLADIEQPVPRSDEVLVRVCATTVTRTDCHVRAADPFVWRLVAGLRRPRRRVSGSEFSGWVEAVGAAVHEFTVGDEVFGIQGLAAAAHAEYLCARASGALAHKPAGVGFEEAAAVLDGALDALAKLRRLGVAPGQKVLVYGASGSIGTAAVQLARAVDAEVTAVCATANVELVHSLGADRVIDYTREDVTQAGERYDAILDAVGKLPFGRCHQLLRAGGSYTAADGWSNLFWLLAARFKGGRRVVFATPRHNKTDVTYLKELIEAGAYRPVIDRTYQLEDMIEATRYVETGQKTGNVVVTINSRGTLLTTYCDSVGEPELFHLCCSDSPKPDSRVPPQLQ